MKTLLDNVGYIQQERVILFFKLGKVRIDKSNLRRSLQQWADNFANAYAV